MRIPVAAIVLATWFPVAALCGSDGIPGIEELAMPVSALSAAMGPVSAGVVSDATAVQDNPARLDEAGMAALAATHTIWPLDFSDTNIQACVWGNGLGGVGLMARMIESSFTEEIEFGDGSYADEGGAFSYRTFKGGIAAAPDLSVLEDLVPGRISAGISAYFLQNEIAGSIRRGAGFSGGIQVDFPPALSFYAIGKELGRIGADPLPASVHVGAAYMRRGVFAGIDRAVLAAEVSTAKGSGRGGAVGGEYELRTYPIGIGLRAGYRIEEEDRAGSWPTAGLVMHWDEFTVGFGLVEMGKLGAGQVLTLSYGRRAEAR